MANVLRCRVTRSAKATIVKTNVQLRWTVHSISLHLILKRHSNLESKIQETTGHVSFPFGDFAFATVDSRDC